MNTPAPDLGSGYASQNICTGSTIGDLAGSALCVASSTVLNSNANRDPGTLSASYVSGTTSKQLLQSAEVTKYGQTVRGADLPTSDGYNYREVPNDTKDDDGFYGTNIKYALRPTTACGSAGNLATRIADCASKNPERSTWDGSLNGHSGEAVWKLVFATGQTVANSCVGAATDCKEVWQDQRTGLVWSSVANGGTAANWCQAAGVTALAPVVLLNAYGSSTPGTTIQGNGTISSISGGASSTANSPITVAFSSATAFAVTGDVGGCNGAGVLGASAGSTVTYTQAGYCSFTFTQGSTPFQNGDTFLLSTIVASTQSCAPGAASALQPAVTGTTGPISYCAELPGFYPGFSGDSWGGAGGWTTGGTYTYDNAKGGMGATSTYPIRWRLPTFPDFEQAEVDGIRHVIPSMGAGGNFRANHDGSPGASTSIWTATVYGISSVTHREWSRYFSSNGTLNATGRGATFQVHCVGR